MTVGQDGDRVCMHDHPLSPVLIGRTLAFIAELCFCALICAAVVKALDTPHSRHVATASLAANFIAQCCCTYSVITRDQRGHVGSRAVRTFVMHAGD